MKHVYGCTWVPNKPQFLTTCMAECKSLCPWSEQGVLLYDFVISQLIFGCVFAPKAGLIIAMGPLDIFIYHPETLLLLSCKSLDYINFYVESFSFTRSSSCISLQLKGAKALVMCLDTLEILGIFELKDDDKFIIRSSFGGIRNKYFANGSPCKLFCLNRTPLSHYPSVSSILRHSHSRKNLYMGLPE